MLRKLATILAAGLALFVGAVFAQGSAPVTIVIALRRGLLDNIRALRHGLQGQPDGASPARARNIMGHGPDGVLARRR